MKKLFITIICTALFFAAFSQKKLTPVSADSKVHFVIKNLGINTGGDLTDLKGAIILDTQHPENSSADVTVAVSTIDTDNERRDGHLKTDDYFDAEKYPTMRIKSTSIKKSATNGQYTFNGTLTIKDVTAPVNFTFTALPLNGGYLFSGDFSINRLAYHVGKESVTMSDDVAISLKIFAK